MRKKQNGGGFWFIAAILFALLVLMQLFDSNTSSVSRGPAAPAGVDRNSFEHRYATERLQQEGYSRAESQQAADAIIKFHNAQQNRSK